MYATNINTQTIGKYKYKFKLCGHLIYQKFYIKMQSILILGQFSGSAQGHHKKMCSISGRTLTEDRLIQ